MKTRSAAIVLLILMGVMILSACGHAPATSTYLQGGSPTMEAPAVAESFSAPQNAVEADAAKSSDPSAGPVLNGSSAPQTDAERAAFAASHMIIKNADVKLLVEDTDIAIDRATQAIADMNGYIISSRVWYQPWYDGQNYKYATITIGVPVDQFEHLLTRLRGFAVKVLDETASGEDVSNQFVDLQSQLTNLEATRERIKAFLDDAKTVDEALRVNQELSSVEAQIEQIKGQMNYLQDRSAFSTITINFEPQLPDQATPTPAPGWNPGATFQDATKAVTHAYQGIVDFLIWVLVVLVPIFAPPLLIIWALWKFFTRGSKKPAQ